MTLTALLLALAAAPQEPAEGWEMQAASVDVRSDAEEIVYVIEGLVLVGPDLRLSADRVQVRLDAARYADWAADDVLPPPPGRALLPGLWSRKLLLALGLPEDETLIRELELAGDVQLDQSRYRLRCRLLRDWPVEGRAEMDDAEIRMPPGSGAPNGWPLAIRARHLREDADGSVYAERAAFSTCDADPLHWSVRFSEVRAKRDADGSLRWDPKGAWLRAGRIPILPLPSPQFRDGDSFLGFRGIRLESSRHYGAMIEPRFGWRWSVPLLDISLDTELFVGLSSRRGVPLRLEGELLSSRVQSDFSLFLLEDRAGDRNPLARTVARDGDTRGRVRWDTLTHFDRGWSLETTLALASDPLVDPEFFHREWVTEDDARSEVYVKQRADDSLFETALAYRLDDFGYAPFEGFGTPPGPAPRTLDTLPRIRYERFSDDLFALPAGFLGGSDGVAPVNFAYGAEVARLELRDMRLETVGATPFATTPDWTRDRARLWSEVAVPLQAGPAWLRPGMRVSGSTWSDSGTGAEDDTQAHFETFVDTGVVLERRWADGWSHRVLPQLRLRSRHAMREPDAVPLDFDGEDQVLEGEVLEFAVRQFFTAPGRSEAWLDVDLLLPYYPDETELLRAETVPYPRTSLQDAGFGPAELRVVWTPGGLGDALAGLRWEARVRHDFDRDLTEEWFTRMEVRPDPAISYGFSYYAADGIGDDFAIGTLFGAYRFAESWGAGFRQSENFEGDAGLNSAYMLHHYGHDFLYEIGWTRREATGEEGFYFYLTPRFLEEDYGSGGLARLRWN